MKKINPETKQFGERLKHLRLRTGLSAEAMAKKIEISSSTYREWENGRAITGMPYKKLASALGVSIGHLFEDYSNHLLKMDEAVDLIESGVKKLRLLL